MECPSAGTGRPPLADTAITRVRDPRRSPSDAEKEIASGGHRIATIDALGEVLLEVTVDGIEDVGVHDTASIAIAATIVCGGRIQSADIVVGLSVPAATVVAPTAVTLGGSGDRPGAAGRRRSPRAATEAARGR
jgi:hypothetical protein